MNRGHFGITEMKIVGRQCTCTYCWFSMDTLLLIVARALKTHNNWWRGMQNTLL